MGHHCHKCNIEYSTISNLRKHVKKFHPDDVTKLAPLRYRKSSPGSNIKCSICKKCFNHTQSLKRHLKIHSSEQNIPVKNLKMKKCPLCDYSDSLKNKLLEHFENIHEIPLKWHSLTFSSMDEFNQWKHETENKSSSNFIIKQRDSFQSHKKIQFVCHRDGDYIPKGQGLRHLKTQGSIKINAYCPANIEIIIESDETVKVKYLESHVGHKCEIGHLHLTKIERDNIATKIAAKIPFDCILDEIRDSITDNDLKRIHLLTKKDIFNIESNYNLCSSSVRHPNDAISVESWVLEMQRHGGCILFYKPQGQILEEQPELRKEDFILIIMTSAQAEILKKFGSDCICLDGTHGLNSYDFELHTLLVIDDLREGFPCAFIITNRSDTDIISLFLSQISKQIGIITPKTFMTDLSEIYFKAWVHVMGVPENRLFCTWHLDRAWRKNLSKINSQEKKASTYKEIRTLLQERDSVAFEKMLLQYCSDKSDPETINFKNYFIENYTNNCKYWAYCYRLHSGLNTNMHLERMHKTIKYVYLGGKKVKRLDKGISALMRFVRDKLIDRLIVINKGKISSKLKNIRDRHKNRDQIDLTSILQTDHGWEVPSTHGDEIYVIQEVNESCTCQLRCAECNICLHRYYCSCHDSAIKFNMCKHIHQLTEFRNQIKTPSTEVQKLSSNELHMDYDEHNESIAIVTQLSKKKKTESTIQERVLNIQREFQNISSSVTSYEQVEAIEKTIKSLPPTLAAIEKTNRENFPPTLKEIPHNKKIEPQRKFISTKKKNTKKKLSLEKPTSTESNVIAFNMLSKE